MTDEQLAALGDDELIALFYRLLDELQLRLMPQHYLEED